MKYKNFISITILVVIINLTFKISSSSDEKNKILDFGTDQSNSLPLTVGFKLGSNLNGANGKLNNPITPFFGTIFEYDFSDYIAGNINLFYNQYTIKEKSNTSTQEDATVKNDSTFVSFLAKYKYKLDDSFRLFGVGGFSFDYLITSQIEINGQILEFKSQQNKFTPYLTIGAGIDYLLNLFSYPAYASFECRYNHGLGYSINSIAFDSKINKSNLQFDLGLKIPIDLSSKHRSKPENIEKKYPNVVVTSNVLSSLENKTAEFNIEKNDDFKDSQISVLIKNQDGEVVKKFDLMNSTSISWNGKDDNDCYVPSFSTYEITIETRNSDGTIISSEPKKIDSEILGESFEEIDVFFVPFKNIYFDDDILDVEKSKTELKKMVAVINSIKSMKIFYIFALIDKNLDTKQKGVEGKIALKRLEQLQNVFNKNGIALTKDKFKPMPIDKYPAMGYYIGIAFKK